MSERLYTLFARQRHEDHYRRLIVDKPFDEVKIAGDALGDEWEATHLTTNANEWPTETSIRKWRDKLWKVRTVQVV